MIPIPDYPDLALRPETYEERFVFPPKMNQISTWYIPFSKHQIEMPFKACEIVDILVCLDGIVYVVILP